MCNAGQPLQEAGDASSQKQHARRQFDSITCFVLLGPAFLTIVTCCAATCCLQEEARAKAEAAAKAKAEQLKKADEQKRQAEQARAAAAEAARKKQVRCRQASL
jgi:uncharacterized membrane protein YqiK